MKRISMLAGCMLIGLFSIAQTKVINDPNAQTRNVRGFHAIRVSGGIDLYLSQGAEAVAVSASRAEYRDKIVTEVENGVLSIHLESNDGHFNWNFHDPKFKAYVSFATLDDLHASGGSDIYLQGTIKTNTLTVRLSGGSDMKGGLDIGDLSVDQSGGSDVDATGSVTNLQITASGGSDFNGYDLKTDNCRINASGGSDAHITVNKELNVNASGGSDVYYKGSGVIREMRSSGSSSISKKG